jgi:hypothetical protein
MSLLADGKKKVMGKQRRGKEEDSWKKATLCSQKRSCKSSIGLQRRDLKLNKR